MGSFLQGLQSQCGLSEILVEPPGERNLHEPGCPGESGRQNLAISYSGQQRECAPHGDGKARQGSEPFTVTLLEFKVSKNCEKLEKERKTQSYEKKEQKTQNNGNY